MEYMTIKQAAERWGYSEETIRKWCKANKLFAVVEAQKISGRGKYQSMRNVRSQLKRKNNTL